MYVHTCIKALTRSFNHASIFRLLPADPKIHHPFHIIGITFASP